MSLQRFQVQSNIAYGCLDEFLSSLRLLNSVLPDDILNHILFVLTREGRLTDTFIMEMDYHWLEDYYKYVGDFLEKMNKETEAATEEAKAAAQRARGRMR